MLNTQISLSFPLTSRLQDREIHNTVLQQHKMFESRPEASWLPDTVNLQIPLSVFIALSIPVAGCTALQWSTAVTHIFFLYSSSNRTLWKSLHQTSFRASHERPEPRVSPHPLALQCPLQTQNQCQVFLSLQRPSLQQQVSPAAQSESLSCSNLWNTKRCCLSSDCHSAEDLLWAGLIRLSAHLTLTVLFPPEHSGANALRNRDDSCLAPLPSALHPSGIAVCWF